MQTNLLKLSLIAFCFAIVISATAQHCMDLKHGENQATIIIKNNDSKGWHKSIVEENSIRAVIPTLLSGDENPDNNPIEHSLPVYGINSYCVPTADCNYGGFIEGITGFAFAGIENYNNGCSENGYGDFTNLEGTVEIGYDYVINIAIGYAPQNVSVWIDLNQDFEFTLDELVVTDFQLTVADVLTEIPILIPGNGLPGATVMRVGSSYYYPSSTDPCGSIFAGEWEDYTLILTGSQINLNAGIVTIDMQPLILQGDVIPTITVKNYGLETISFPVTCNINDNGYTSTKSVNNLAFNEEAQILFDQWTVEPGTYDMEVITQLPGDEITANDTVNCTLGIIEYIPTKKVVGEEGTGTWCGYCPRGIVYMDSMQMKYPDTWIGIAIHSFNLDPMTVVEYDTSFAPLIYSMYPGAIADRAIHTDPSLLEAAYLERISKISPAGISIENKSYNSTSGELSFTLTSDFVAQVNSFRFNAVIKENNVTGTGPGWAQANYYSGGALGPMGGYELLPDPVPAEDMVYQDVARAILGGFDGAEGSLPGTVYAGETHSYDFSITIPEEWDVTNIEIVGMLMDNTTGRIENACKDELITAVPEISGNTNFTIFPNPAKDAFTIHADIQNASLYICDLAGKILLIKEKVTDGTIVNLTDIKNGIYMVRIVENEKVFNTKIAVVH